MDLVEEDDGGAAFQGGGVARGLDHPAQRRHAVGGGVQGLEPRPDRLREQAADGRLAGSRRAPQDAGGQPAALDQAKRRPRPEEGGLADHLVQRPGAHPVRERPEVKGRGEKRGRGGASRATGHGAVVPEGGGRPASGSGDPEDPGDLREEEGREQDREDADDHCRSGRAAPA